MSNTVTSDARNEISLPKRGFYSFVAISFSQFISALGMALAGFGLSVWVFQTTKSATALSLLAMCSVLPRASLSVFAGAAVDRYGVRRAMMAGVLGASISLAPCLLLAWNGQLKLWHICISMAIASAWQSLLWPAVSAAVPLLVAEKEFVRANGVLQAGNAATGIIAPLVGGVVALHYDVGVVLAVTLLIYASSLPMLIVTRVPHPETTNKRAEGRSYMKEIADAWSFLRHEATLLRLTIVFAAFSFVVSIATVLMKPLILSFASASALGTVMSVGSLGMLLGGLAVMVSGKGARNFKQVMSLITVAGFCMAVAGGRPMVLLIAIATFAYLFTMAIVSSGVQAIIQTSVPVDLQGRMHATLAAVSLATMPLAFPIAGPLADYVFEPLVATGGPLADSVGWVIGVGAGRGIGLLFIVLGILIIGLSLIGQVEPQRALRRANALAASQQE